MAMDIAFYHFLAWAGDPCYNPLPLVQDKALQRPDSAERAGGGLWKFKGGEMFRNWFLELPLGNLEKNPGV